MTAVLLDGGVAYEAVVAAAGLPVVDEDLILVAGLVEVAIGAVGDGTRGAVGLLLQLHKLVVVVAELEVEGQMVLAGLLVVLHLVVVAGPVVAPTSANVGVLRAGGRS